METGFQAKISKNGPVITVLFPDLEDRIQTGWEHTLQELALEKVQQWARVNKEFILESEVHFTEFHIKTKSSTFIWTPDPGFFLAH